ncbi:MAG: threonine/serine dehydratase [Gammaproteobacteria bacterium]|nr:threonine/serine dehydratase [Gammaproteobacteria bacterium]
MLNVNSLPVEEPYVPEPQTDLPVHLDDVYQAQKVISDRLARTPFLNHPLLDAALGCHAQVKLENTHDIGSFKIRGSLNLLAQLSEAERAPGLVTATKGNHGQSLARAAALYRTACTIFVPENNNADKNRAMTALGADVRVEGHDFDAAWVASERFVRETGARAVHPAREPALIAGVATAALEMIEQTERPLDYVFVPVGGGSIAAGTALVVKQLSPATRVIAVQCENAPAMHYAWHHGEERPFAVTHTVADGLAVRVPVDYTLAFMREYVDDMLLVSEEEIFRAMRLYASTLHQMVEGAGAVPLAGATQMADELEGANVGLIVTGGNVEAATMMSALSGRYETVPPQAMPMYPLSSIDYGCR